jgi:hypothetical protein
MPADLDLSARDGGSGARRSERVTTPIGLCRRAGWTAFVEQGFGAAVAGSAVSAVVTKWGDTGTEIKLNNQGTSGDPGLPGQARQWHRMGLPSP